VGVKMVKTKIRQNNDKEYEVETQGERKIKISRRHSVSSKARNFIT
jgi:hypothetical protein